jgi:hypothetical protein
MNKLQFLLLFLCFLGITNLFAQPSIIVKDTAGVEQTLTYSKTKVLMCFHDMTRAPVKVKIMNFEDGKFYLNNGTIVNVDLVKELSLQGPKSGSERVKILYYFFAINASLISVFIATGRGFETAFYIDAIVVLTTPITMFVVPKAIEKIIRQKNIVIIPMEGNFK